MGLDMYLTSVGESGKKEVAYWRKANQIRQWLVEHDLIEYDDDCVERLISRDKLEELIEDCKFVLDNRDKASSVLPVSDGFFFGSQEYDKYYFEHLEDTIEMLTKALAGAANDTVFIYHDSW